MVFTLTGMVDYEMSPTPVVEDRLQPNGRPMLTSVVVYNLALDVDDTVVSDRI